MKKLKKALVLILAVFFLSAGVCSTSAFAAYHQCKNEKPCKYCQGDKKACEKKGCNVLQTISSKPADYTPKKVCSP
jgi:hypothetical protein